MLFSALCPVLSELFYLKPIYGIAEYCLVNNIRTRISPELHSPVLGNVQAGQRGQLQPIRGRESHV